MHEQERVHLVDVAPARVVGREEPADRLRRAIRGELAVEDEDRRHVELRDVQRGHAAALGRVALNRALDVAPGVLDLRPAVDDDQLQLVRMMRYEIVQSVTGDAPKRLPVVHPVRDAVVRVVHPPAGHPARAVGHDAFCIVYDHQKMRVI